VYLYETVLIAECQRWVRLGQVKLPWVGLVQTFWVESGFKKRPMSNSALMCATDCIV